MIILEEKLSVCLLNDSFPPLIDGVANTVMNYADIINEKFGKAAVSVPYYPENRDESFPYKIIRYPSLATEKLLNYRAGYPFSFEALEKIKAENVNIIHTHCPFASTFLARTLREPLDAPVIFTYHTKFDIDIARAVGEGFLKETIIREVVRNIESCDEVWVVSEGAGENLRSLGYKGEYIVMPNGVDIPRGKVSPEEIEKAIAGYDLPEKIPVFLFVGRMAWYKGLDIILDSLKIISRLGDDFRMVFIGGGLDGEEVEKYAAGLGIAEKCIFTGPIHDRNKIRAWYSRADLFLFPSVYDTNGLVVREAAACSLGSILIEGSCAAEGITDGETGFLSKNNPEDFAGKLHSLCLEPKKMKEAGKNAMEKIYVSWEESVANAVKRYETVLENYRAGKYERKSSFGDEWFRAEGEILDGINRAKTKGRRLQSGMARYGRKMLERPGRAAESFNRRRIRIKNYAFEKGRKVKRSFSEKIDRYF